MQTINTSIIAHSGWRIFAKYSHPLDFFFMLQPQTFFILFYFIGI